LSSVEKPSPAGFGRHEGAKYVFDCGSTMTTAVPGAAIVVLKTMPAISRTALNPAMAKIRLGLLMFILYRLASLHEQQLAAASCCSST
jgi:hypothetical protein